MKLIETEDGFFTVSPKPSATELQTYYRDQYYSAPVASSQYAHPYTDEERSHKTLAAAEAEFVAGQVHGGASGGSRRFLELGFGEGFVVDYFHRAGWSVDGIDFSSDAIARFFPSLLPKLEFGDLYGFLDQLVARGHTYDLVICNHVLEHVLDPVRVVQGLARILRPGRICRIQVPNDGSWLQHEIVSRGLARENYWHRPPEHLNYFTREPLIRLLEGNGWRIVDVLADFPIEAFLLNPDSNYEQVVEAGRHCHFAKVAFEMSLARQSIEDLVEFRRGCARAGTGRCLIVYATVAPENGREEGRLS